MGMLDRYKKKGGFVQLLQLIETSAPAKQEQLLGLVGKEDPLWEQEIRKKMLTLPVVLSWNATYLHEIVTRSKPLTVATIIKGLDPEAGEKVLSYYGHTDRRRVELMLSEVKPNPGEWQSCVQKLLMEVRELIAKGLIRLQKIDMQLFIPERMEEILAERAKGREVSVELPEDADPAAVAAILRGEGGSKASLSPNQATIASPGAKNVEVKKANDPGRVQENKTSSGTEQASEAAELFRKKISALSTELHQLKAENQTLRNEVIELRNKMERIKKLA